MWVNRGGGKAPFRFASKRNRTTLMIVSYGNFYDVGALSCRRSRFAPFITIHGNCLGTTGAGTKQSKPTIEFERRKFNPKSFSFEKHYTDWTVRLRRNGRD